MAIGSGQQARVDTYGPPSSTAAEGRSWRYQKNMHFWSTRCRRTSTLIWRIAQFATRWTVGQVIIQAFIRILYQQKKKPTHHPEVKILEEFFRITADHHRNSKTIETIDRVVRRHQDEKSLGEEDRRRRVDVCHNSQHPFHLWRPTFTNTYKAYSITGSYLTFIIYTSFIERRFSDTSTITWGK